MPGLGSLSTSKERDAETGLDYFGARYLSMEQGRFTTPDPFGDVIADPTNPQSWNLYAYVRNNPLNLVDPSGYFCAHLNGTGDAISASTPTRTRGTVRTTAAIGSMAQ